MPPHHLPAAHTVIAHLRRNDLDAARAAVADAFTRGAEDAQSALSVLACALASRPCAFLCGPDGGAGLGVRP